MRAARASCVTLRGTALHAGGPASVSLARAAGPVVLEQAGAAASLAELTATGTFRGVTVEAPRLRVDLVEHLLAALGGLGVREGVRAAIEGAEVPLLDGGARRFVEALRAIEAPVGSPPPLVVRRAATLQHAGASYRFEPGPRVMIEVLVDFPPPVGRELAAWEGDPDDFADRIAPARTFGWLADHAALRAAGRAASVDLESVIVFDGATVMAGCRPPDRGEIARHKLLDLVGDLALHGGPPRGAVRASAPGHAATHAVVREALSSGVLGIGP